MERENIREEVLKIQKDLDIGHIGMSQAMGITPGVYRAKKSEKQIRHWFNEQNLIDLKLFIKNYARTL